MISRRLVTAANTVMVLANTVMVLANTVMVLANTVMVVVVRPLLVRSLAWRTQRESDSRSGGLSCMVATMHARQHMVSLTFTLAISRPAD